MSTLTGPVEALEEVSRLASESVGPWLREYEGYRGTFVFVDAEAGTARLITLWESAQDEERARDSRGAMRDQLATTAGMDVVSFEVFDVLAHELIRATFSSAQLLVHDELEHLDARSPADSFRRSETVECLVHALSILGARGEHEVDTGSRLATDEGHDALHAVLERGVGLRHPLWPLLDDPSELLDVTIDRGRVGAFEPRHAYVDVPSVH